MMTASESEGRCRTWRMGLILFFASLLPAQAQAAERVPAAPLLAPWTTLAGARVAARLQSLPAQPRQPEFAGYLPWLLPTAVAVRNNHVYVVDGGRRRIFVYDPLQQSMTPFTEYNAGAVSAIAVGPDMSLYVADTGARQVLHFSADGRLLQRFSNERELARPVAVLLDEASGGLWVADGLYNQVVLFSSLGRVQAVLQSNESRSIEGMARGPDGLYLLDRVGKQVVVMGQDGLDRYTFGSGTLQHPAAIAVDRFNRVFVGDRFDNTIKVYEHRQLAASFGADFAAFKRITGLWLEQNMLYVADSMNARIQTFRVAPPALKVPTDE